MRTIGHYYKNAFCSSDETLSELTDANFNQVVSSIPYCEYDKSTDRSKYTEWKQVNLPIVYFTTGSHRPDKTDIGLCSNYAVIDIDDKPGVRYETTNPSVCCINYTGNGTHIFIYTKDWGKTPMEWQATYNSIAYSVWIDLKQKYGDLKLDGHCANHTWGCFLWNTEWKSNPNFDRSSVPVERYINDSILSDMYEAGTYKKSEHSTLKNYSKKNALARVEVRYNNSIDVMEELADMSSISSGMRDDFFTMNKTDFLRRYESEYMPIVGTMPEFSEYTDYEGNTYMMYNTKGEMVTLWNKYMQPKKDLAMKEDGHLDYSIKKGGRRRSLYSHLLQAAQFLEFEGRMSADHILYDGVYWVANHCEEGLSFPNREIMETVSSVLVNYRFEEDRMHYDRRKMVSGPEMIDVETGEVVRMDKGMKLRANARCRKTERIKEVVSQWDPNKNAEWNAEHIRSWEDDTTKKLSEKTFVSYIEAAKNMPELVEKYEWLASFEVEKKSVGRQNQSITIKNVETGEVVTFKSKSECMEWLKIGSKTTFQKFLKGLTKMNKTFQAI